MRQIFVVLLFVGLIVLQVHCCSNANWLQTMRRKGYTTCPSLKYINGLWRNANKGHKDGLYQIARARCCPRPLPYKNQAPECLAADWVHSFDHNYRWNSCPSGFFLNGLYRGKSHWLHNIEYGKCCKPAHHPYYWGRCYNQDVSLSFSKKGLSKCKNGYFIAGLYRGDCDRLYCIRKFKCCQMFPKPPPLQSLADAKTRVMDTTMYYLSLLAHFLGYGWCAGCRAENVGEDFKRNGDSWEADTKGPCKGYKANHRLKIRYGNFKFSIKDIKYGKPKIQSLKPTVFDSGKVTNTDSTPLKQSITREIRSVRTVTHTTTSSWKVATELGIEISYTPPSVTGGPGAKTSFKFSFENSKTTTDSTSKQQYKSIQISSEKTLKPHSAARWQIMLSKTRTTVPYTAVVLVHFSAELKGFLRWGGGYHGKSTNYHYKHRGSSKRPEVSYRFGSSSVPFYEALKRQSTQDRRPWLWSDMKNRYSSAQGVIDRLTNEGQYEFTLTGQFEDVVGHHADVQWHTVPLQRRHAASSDDHTSRGSSSKPNPPRLFPRPPKVTINEGNFTKIIKPIKILNDPDN